MLRNLLSSLSVAAAAAAVAATATAPPLCVASADGTLVACVDASTGCVASLAPRGAAAAWELNATTLLGDAAVPSGAPTVTGSPLGVTVVRRWSFAAGGAAPAGAGAIVTETFSPAPTSVRWHVSVAGTGATPWSVPIVTSAVFGAAASAAMKLWAPWDRGSGAGWSASWVDPLQPSDVRAGGWWTGNYWLGNNRGGGKRADFIVAALAAVLSADPAASDAGVSFALAPTDVPMDTRLDTDGPGGGFAFTRTHHRISNFAAVELDIDIVGHEADWRASLGWSVQRWPEHWSPVNAEVYATAAGTGSYSWYEGSLASDPPYSDMAYKVNWDLSGRYFPYMGMYLPPVSPGEAWENDPEGSQTRANVTFESIGAWYRQMASAGFLDLSYYNVNEYGLNVVLPPPPPPVATAPPSPPSGSRSVDAKYISRLFARVAGGAGVSCGTTWPNASACLAEAFPDAALTRSWDEIGGRVVQGAYYSWQNAIVVDPGVESYHAFMLEQLARHIVYEDAFGGIIVDRSEHVPQNVYGDHLPSRNLTLVLPTSASPTTSRTALCFPNARSWMDVSSLQRDDGLTFIPEAVVNGSSGVGASLKVAYQRMIADLRAVLDAGPSAARGMNGAGIMMMNVLGNARLDVFRHYDGIFSEGSLVNAAGLLGAMSPTILWT